MIFTDILGNKTNKAYFEGGFYLDKLEDYWYEITLNGKEITVIDLHDGGYADEIKEYLIDELGAEDNYIEWDFYSICEDYESERLKVIIE